MAIRKIGTSRIVYPSRRGGSTDNNPVFPDRQPNFIPFDEETAFPYRNRAVSSKILYPSRRGGSADNNDPITPLGIEEESWMPPRTRPWILVKAFIDDEVYVNTCAEDYLFIATQAFWQLPLVPAYDDEVIPIAASLGIEDELLWLARTSRYWKCAIQPVSDDVLPSAAMARSYVFII